MPANALDPAPLNRKLAALANTANEREVSIAIVGLGSVGNYLLNYLLESRYHLKITVLGRSADTMRTDLNIAQVAASIRGCRPVRCEIREVDLNNVDQLAEILGNVSPDVIVNSSRAYSHVKYGSISWNAVRAYGIWAPLSVKYARNLMKAVSQTPIDPIVINTSYSDAVNAWIKTAGLACPDFGSGNLNHLIPRIRFAVAREFKIADSENIDICLATSHFHDVVISKEGQVEGIPPLLAIRYGGQALQPDMPRIYAECAISMPADARRNMMNASSNFEIVSRLMTALANGTIEKLHIPGAMGLLGGYPLIVDGTRPDPKIFVDETHFSLAQMQKHNADSIYLDGIASVADGVLVYTDELVAKTRRHFGFALPKSLHLADADLLAGELITQVIEKRK